MGYRKYSDELKEKVVKEYLAGATPREIWNKYEIKKDRVFKWAKKWKEHETFPDGRGKSKTGRPRKVRREDMTDEEYIAYLEMQLEIKKYMAFYEKRKQK